MAENGKHEENGEEEEDVEDPTDKPRIPYLLGRDGQPRGSKDGKLGPQQFAEMQEVKNRPREAVRFRETRSGAWDELNRLDAAASTSATERLDGMLVRAEEHEIGWYNNDENFNHYSYFKYFEYKNYHQRFVEFMNISLECENRKKFQLKKQVLRDVSDWRDCRNSCNDHAECAYFNYNKKRKTCSLIRTHYKACRNFVSGPKYCDL